MILINNDFFAKSAASAGGFSACLQGADRRKPRFCWGKWESVPSTTSISASQASKNRCYLRKRARKPRCRRPGSLYTRRPGECSGRHPTVSIKSVRALIDDRLSFSRLFRPNCMIVSGHRNKNARPSAEATRRAFSSSQTHSSFPNRQRARRRSRRQKR